MKPFCSWQLRIPRSYLLGILSFLGACGAPRKPALSVFLPGQQVTEDELRTALGQSNEKPSKKSRKLLSQTDILRIQRWSLIGDTDKNGIPDSHDPDMDGDGVPNFADPFPLSRDAGTLDSDADGIPDWIDESLRLKNPDLSELNELQERIFRNHKVIVMRSWVETFSGSSYLAAMRDFETLLQDQRMAIFNPSEKTKVVVVDNSIDLTLCGRYDPDWQTLEFFMVSQGCPSAQITLTHELFHAIQASRPKVFLNFLRVAGWNFEPSSLDHQRMVDRQVNAEISLRKTFDDGATIEVFSTESILMAWKGSTAELFDQNTRLKTWFVRPYALSNPIEHFADSGTVSWLSTDSSTPDLLEQYPNTTFYLESELHDYFKKIWKNGAHLE